MVAAGLARCWREWSRVAESLPDSAASQAERAARLAVLCEREARWWEVLERWTYGPEGSVPLVFGRAVMAVSDARRDHSRFWDGLAGDWRRRAAGEPVCGVIGCGCGGVCGVSA
jgi:hypothetical protein